MQLESLNDFIYSIRTAKQYADRLRREIKKQGIQNEQFEKIEEICDQIDEIEEPEMAK